MHIHILGICGTFMGGIALLARAQGYQVTGSDAHVYPPMSTQLEAAGIQLMEGYLPEHLQPAPDWVVVGNAMTRGNPAVEYMLNQGLAYTSGPQWLSEHVLQKTWVLGVAGTHGKTTTASMLAWILEDANMEPGFLIGGIPQNFGLSARFGAGQFFVVEADEYDTAFFDKRSKFVHYRARTCILNNLEFDHADIFDDLAQIQTQFHHLVRTIPSEGMVIYPPQDQAILTVLEKGCWSEKATFNAADTTDALWTAQNKKADGSAFDVFKKDQFQGHIEWDLTGLHNVNNALAAIAGAEHVGVPAKIACEALAQFKNVKRRMELKGEVKGIKVYDDFAHHPTAIKTTLAGLRAQVGKQRIIAILEPRSNTMQMGVHQKTLAHSLQEADDIAVFISENLAWNGADTFASLESKVKLFQKTQAIIDWVVENAHPHDIILIMSNGGFEGIHQRILTHLADK